MNRLVYDGSKVTNLKGIKSRADIPLRKTLDFIADNLLETYHTPDDRIFKFGFEVVLSNTSSGPNIKVFCNMIPKEVIDGKIQQYKNKAMLILELHYDTDVEMTEHLYCDIMKLLAHLGKSALYNESRETIYATRGRT